MLISLILILTLVFRYSIVKETDNIRFSNEYKSIPTNNKFVYKNIDEIINIIKNESGIIYFGFPECIWCQEYVKYLNDVASEENVNAIYYYNIKQDRNNNTESYNELISILSDYLILNGDGNKQLYVPNTTIVKNGTIIYNNNETASIDENVVPNEYWTISKINKFKEELNSYIKEIK